MCENITNKYLYEDKITFLKKKIKNNIDNPKLLIQKFKYKNITINLIQDGVLLTGTKQRVVKLFFKKILKENPKIKTVLYAGSCNGFGAIATAYGAYKLGLKCEVFLSKIPDLTDDNIFESRQINTLHALDANIYLCPTYPEARELEYKNSTIKIGKKSWKTAPEYYISPMGLNDDDKIMINLLSKQIIKSSKNTILENYNNPRIWLVTGSGGIAMSLSKAFPFAKLFILLTGGGRHKKNVYDWAKNEKNVFIIKNESILDNKSEINDRHLYYSSVTGYDDLIWPYVKKYGKDNDFIWNIASEDYIL